MSTYYVLSGLKHNGDTYRRGDEIELTDETASGLVEAGVVQADPVDTPAPEQKAEAPAEQTRPESADVARVGGETTTSGEPSLDRQEAASGRSEATDVTPGVDKEPIDTPAPEQKQSRGILGIFGPRKSETEVEQQNDPSDGL